MRRLSGAQKARIRRCRENASNWLARRERRAEYRATMIRNFPEAHDRLRAIRTMTNREHTIWSRVGRPSHIIDLILDDPENGIGRTEEFSHARL